MIKDYEDLVQIGQRYHDDARMITGLTEEVNQGVIIMQIHGPDSEAIESPVLPWRRVRLVVRKSQGSEIAAQAAAEINGNGHRLARRQNS